MEAHGNKRPAGSYYDFLRDISQFSQNDENKAAGGGFAPNANATIVFRPTSVSKSPKIGGVVRQVERSDSGATALIEIEDWDLLAKFWREQRT